MLLFVATVDHDPAAGLAVAVGHREDAVIRGTAVGAVPIIVTVATARRAALAAAVVTRVARAVTTEVAPAVVPAVAIVTTEKRNSLKPTTTVWSARKTTVKRPSHRDRQTDRRRRSRTTDPNEKAVPRPITDPKMVLQVHRLNGLAVAAIAVVVADRQTRTTKVGCCSGGVVAFAVVSLPRTSLRQVAILWHTSCDLSYVFFHV